MQQNSASLERQSSNCYAPTNPSEYATINANITSSHFLGSLRRPWMTSGGLAYGLATSTGPGSRTGGQFENDEILRCNTGAYQTSVTLQQPLNVSAGDGASQAALRNSEEHSSVTAPLLAQYFTSQQAPSDINTSMFGLDDPPLENFASSTFTYAPADEELWQSSNAPDGVMHNSGPLPTPLSAIAQLGMVSENLQQSPNDDQMSPDIVSMGHSSPEQQEARRRSSVSLLTPSALQQITEPNSHKRVYPFEDSDLPRQHPALPDVSQKPITNVPQPLSTSVPASAPEAISAQAPQTSRKFSGTMPIIQTLKARNLYGPLEAERLSYLRDACRLQDLFYLLLHQQYCLWTLGALHPSLMALGRPVQEGLSKLELIIKSNRMLRQEALVIFSKFHFSISQARDAPQESWPVFLQLQHFLTTFSGQWDSLRQACVARGFAPCAHEQQWRLSLPSLALQKIIFTHIHRELDRTKNPIFEGKAIQLFEMDMLQYDLIHLPGDQLVQPQVLTDDISKFGANYLYLRAQLSDKRLTIQHFGGPTNRLSLNPWTRMNPLSTTQATAGLESQPLPAADTNYPTPAVAAQGSNGLNVSLPHRMNTAAHQTQVLSMGSVTPQRLMDSLLANQPYITPQLAATAMRRLPVQNEPETGLQGTIAPSMLQATTQAVGPQLPGFSFAHVPVPNLPFYGLTQTRGLQQTPSNICSAAGRLPTASRGTAPLVAPFNRLRTSVAMKVDSQDKEDADLRLYSYLEKFAVPPQILHPHMAMSWRFTADSLDWRNKVSDRITGDRGPVLTRIFTNGSKLFRLRCVQLADRTMMVNEAAWSVMPVAWPRRCTLLLNDTAVEIPELQNGKYSALDFTSLVRRGVNTVRIKVESPHKKPSPVYAIAVEVIKVIDHVTALQMPVVKSFEESLATILQGFIKPDPETKGADDELEIVDTGISIDLVDPFTAKIFLTPVRGTACSHRECFDLDSWLQSRVPVKNGPTNADEWKCPICKRDARPPSLIIDGFLKEMRLALSDADLNNVRAILVRPDGTWKLKREVGCEGRRQSGKATASGDASDNESLNGDTDMRAEELMAAGHLHEQPVVIELDD